MPKTARGIASGAFNFVIVGVVFPFLIEYFAAAISKYVPLPAASEVWTVFIVLGVAFAITGFLQRAYSKGEYPWLAGKLLSAVASIGFYTFVFSLIPSGARSGGTIETSNLLYLIYLAIALAYGYLILDFYDARRNAAGYQRKVPTVSIGE